MYLIILHGLPATGKTTLGRQLADTLNIPFISKDTYKEKLYETFGNHDDSLQWSRQLGAASFEVVYTILEELCRAGTSCVAETFWNPDFAEPRLNDLIARYHAHCVQIFCETEAQELATRFSQRAATTRHAAHMDQQRLANNHHDIISATHPHNRVLRLDGEVIKINTTEFAKLNPKDILHAIQPWITI